jgi:DNA-binding MarR family transcriptional regulator
MKQQKFNPEELAIAAWKAEFGEDQVPAGFYSVSQLAKLFGLHRATISRRIEKLLESGKAEKRGLKIRNGRTFQVTDYYKLKA